MDVAASEFYNAENKVYNLGFKTDKANNLNGEELCNFYISLCKKYPIISIEDPFDENDFTSYAHLLKTIKEEKLPV